MTTAEVEVDQITIGVDLGSADMPIRDSKGRFLAGHGDTGAGRPKGSKDTTPRDLAQQVLEVFAGLGGAKAMMDWAKDNKRDFYFMLSKLFPKAIDVSVQAGTVEDRIAELESSQPKLALPDPKTALLE